MTEEEKRIAALVRSYKTRIEILEAELEKVRKELRKYTKGGC